MPRSIQIIPLSSQLCLMMLQTGSGAYRRKQMGSLLMTTGCLSALLLTSSSAGAPTSSDRSEEIRLKAENGFYGLSWEVDIWRDRDGFHRTTTVTGMLSEDRLTETVNVRSADVEKLWQTLESLHCWGGPKHKDWTLKETDRGTVFLNRKGRTKTFDYVEAWEVAVAISKFGQLDNLLATARQKHL